MKTIANKTQAAHVVIREDNETAAELVKSHGWQYVPKSLWKTTIRDANK